MLYWLAKHLVVGPFIRSTFRPWVTGGDNIPGRGQVILASNHLSVIDSIFLPLLVKRRVTFLAKSEYFTGKGFKGLLTRLAMKATGMLPIDRSGGRASQASLDSGLKVLGRGDVLGIYPEGTRSPDGRMFRGRTGVARMILESGAPVVPVAMIDTEKVMPIGAKMPKIRKIGVVVGEPLDFSRYRGLEPDRYVLRSITDEIIVALNRLSGQEYVDIYASTIRNKMARNAGPEAQPASADSDHIRDAA